VTLKKEKKQTHKRIKKRRDRGRIADVAAIIADATSMALVNARFLDDGASREILAVSAPLRKIHKSHVFSPEADAALRKWENGSPVMLSALPLAPTMSHRYSAVSLIIAGIVVPGGSKPDERRGGRQKGTRNKRTNVRLAESARIEAAARAEGISPVELMVKSMRMLWRQAHARPGDPDRELVAQACGIARDVAPYLHPRLTSIAAKIEAVHLLPDDLLALRLEEGLTRLDQMLLPAAANDEGSAGAIRQRRGRSRHRDGGDRSRHHRTAQRDFRPSTYPDRYQEALRGLIRNETEGPAHQTPRGHHAAPVIDLMAALKRRLAQETHPAGATAIKQKRAKPTDERRQRSSLLPSTCGRPPNKERGGCDRVGCRGDETAEESVSAAIRAALRSEYHGSFGHPEAASAFRRCSSCHSTEPRA
jgi:hypothetical protein